MRADAAGLQGLRVRPLGHEVRPRQRLAPELPEQTDLLRSPGLGWVWPCRHLSPHLSRTTQPPRYQRDQTLSVRPKQLPWPLSAGRPPSSWRVRRTGPRGVAPWTTTVRMLRHRRALQARRFPLTGRPPPS